MHTLSTYFSRGAVLLAAVLLAACAAATRTPGVVDVPVGEFEEGEVTVTGLGDEFAAEGEFGGDDAGAEAAPAEQVDFSEEELLAKRVIYFDFDSSLLGALGEAVAGAHARYLRANASARIILEGHADERGTREYNLALGEDRAGTVADVLQALGVETSRIEMVSYGEERPQAAGHDESAWRLNRRVEILYK